MLAVFACNRELYKVELHGKIMDATTGQPLKDAKVEVIQYESDIPFFGPGNVVADGISEENGNYKIVFRPKIDRIDYTVRVSKENYADGRPEEYEIMEDDHTYQRDYSIFPISQLELTVIKTDSFGYNDKFEVGFRFVNTVYDDETEIDYINWNQNGVYKNETQNFKIVGNTYTVFTWKITRQGITNSYKDSIYVEAFKSAKYKIEY